MWLEGIYMAGPFYAEFAGTFNDPTAFDNVAHQQGRRSFHHGKR
jgi:unsaturated rhamnogalacturonyl hydrolase